MKSLITGAAGFLGSHIVEALLKRGDEVVAFDHRLRGKCLANDILSRTVAIQGDVLDPAAVRQAAAGCGVIFHCAAIVGVDAYSSLPARTMETEEAGLRNVCRAAIESGNMKVIYASSSAVYGDTASGEPLRENAVVAPVSNYGIAKRFNELYLASQHSECGLASTSLRIFNMYGPRQDSRLVIPRFIQSALAGRELEIYGDGLQIRDFIYVADVVNAALASADADARCEILNVCSGIGTTIVQLASTIIQLAGSKSDIRFFGQPSKRSAFEVRQSIGSCQKLMELTGRHSGATLREGLLKTIDATVKL